MNNIKSDCREVLSLVVAGPNDQTVPFFTLKQGKDIILGRLHCTAPITSLIQSILIPTLVFVNTSLYCSLYSKLSLSLHSATHPHYPQNNFTYIFPINPIPVTHKYSTKPCTFPQMATNTATPQEKKLEQLKEEEGEEGEEEDEEEEIEALSLCDLPINLINDETQPKPEPDSQIIETREDFDFRLWGTPFSSESEMCAADEVFFQGQILPLRLSLKRCQSRSESLGHGSLREFRSNSSRSSSIRSQNSTSSSSSTSTTTPGISKPRPQNQNQNHFHAHPSPQPQLKVTIPRQTSFGNQGRKSSAWDFFRLGVVPAPEIALQDLKVRSTNGINKNHIARNNSSNNSSNNSNSAVKRSYSAKGNHVLKQFVGIGGGFWSGCKCSVETVQSNITMIEGSTKSANKTESVTHAMKEKAVERKKQKQRQKQGKRTMSRRRTFEWIKELSHDASYADDETLLSKS